VHFFAQFGKFSSIMRMTPNLLRWPILHKILHVQNRMRRILTSLFLTLLNLGISFWFRIMHCCIPTFTIDNNTSTGMI